MMILLHEIPWAITNINNLIIHLHGPLPLNFAGCFSLVLSLWQYLTYPTIFLIYACMSESFRTELVYILTISCKKRSRSLSDTNKLFISPCTVRKSFSREHRGDEHEDCDDCDIDSCI
jgi:hypothetical protein